MDKLEETLLQNIPGNAKHSRKCISFNCPCCMYMGESRNDTRGRGGLFIEMDHIGYNCFNCGFKFRQYRDQKLDFSTRKFLELCGAADSDINLVQFTMMKNNHEKNPLEELMDKNKKKKTQTVNFNYKECNMPDNVHFIHDIIMDSEPESDVFKAYMYAQKRGIADWPFLMWSSSKKNNMNKRLIIPFIHNGKFVGYTARSFLKDVKKNNRYVTENPNTGKYVFNIQSMNKKRKFNVLTESPIDSILYDGFATMSFSPGKEQINTLNAVKSEKILVPDISDTAGKKFITTAADNEWSVFFPFWNPDMDLGEATNLYGKAFVLANIIKYRETNPVSINVKSNLL